MSDYCRLARDSGAMPQNQKVVTHTELPTKGNLWRDWVGSYLFYHSASRVDACACAPTGRLIIFAIFGQRWLALKRFETTKRR